MTEAAITDLAAYTRIYEEHNARLVAYAVTLTGNPSTAEDLVAEAHFRVWRRISGGHAVENVPAYLAATIRNLSNSLHRTGAEIPLPADAAEAVQAEFGRPGATVSQDDPSQRVAHVDYVTRLLKDLPERWVRALWLAEVEDLPLETVGRRIGANSNATAVLLNRAREGLRQAFLRGYPGAPAAEACAKHWQKMPSLVRGGLSARQTDSIRMHAEQCDDCRARLAALQQVNLRLPVLLGPALLVFTLGGGAVRLLAVAGGGGGAGAAGTAGSAKTAGLAKSAGLAKTTGVAGKLRHGVSSGGKATVVSAGVLGSAAIAVAAVALTGAGHPGAAVRTQEPASQPAKAATAPAAKTTPTKKTAAAATAPASAPAPAPAAKPAPTPTPAAKPAPTPAANPAPTPAPGAEPAAASPASKPAATTPQAVAAAAAPAANQHPVTQAAVAPQPASTKPFTPAQPAAAKPATPPPTSPPAQYTARHAAPAPATQTSVTPQATPTPSTPSRPSTPLTPSTPPASPTPNPDIHVALTTSPLPEVTVTVHLPSPGDQGHKAKPTTPPATNPPHPAPPAETRSPNLSSKSPT